MSLCCCSEVQTDQSEVKTVNSQRASNLGPSDDDLLAKELATGPRTFEIVVTKTETQSTVGLDVTRKNGINLRIQSVKPGGLIEGWNNQQPTTATIVKVDDTIEAVNGAEGSVQEILQAISQAKVLRMKISTRS
mmetsp:Transcript_67023/g.132161  ORF Transcript_67023/g.132161 Transcript_67023/m.132161 type:complete len:134 (+) Transcript_67023:65-466(+)